MIPFALELASETRTFVICVSTYSFINFTEGYLVVDNASALISIDLLVAISLPAKPMTTGEAEVPPKSPANWTIPLTLVLASDTPPLLI